MTDEELQRRIAEWEDLTDDTVRAALKAHASGMIEKAEQFGAAEATSTFEGRRGDDVLTIAEVVPGAWAAVWIETGPKGPQTSWMVRK